MTELEEEFYYNRIWAIIASKVSDQVTCDYLTDQIMDIFKYKDGWKKELTEEELEERVRAFNEFQDQFKFILDNQK